MFGPPPSPLGIVAIATASALGLAQMAAIQKAKFHHGGVVPGPFGQERTIVAEGGELVIPKEAARNILSPRSAAGDAALLGAGVGGSSLSQVNSLALSLTAGGRAVDPEEMPEDIRRLAGGFNELVEASSLRVVATHVMVNGEPVPASRLRI